MSRRLTNMSPEPTTGTNYDSYLMPRSKTPAKDALYLRLHDLGWRFDANTATWHTPEDAPAHAFGALQHDPDLRTATIQPPSVRDETLDPPWRRPAPILKLVRSRMFWLEQEVTE